MTLELIGPQHDDYLIQRSMGLHDHWQGSHAVSLRILMVGAIDRSAIEPFFDNFILWPQSCQDTGPALGMTTGIKGIEAPKQRIRMLVAYFPLAVLTLPVHSVIPPLRM